MQFVPVNSSPPATGEEHEVKRVYGPKPAEAASEAPSPFSFNFKPVKKPLPRNPTAVEPQHVFHERSEEERRKYCRRLQNTPVLYDLRSGMDRRRKNQRKSDVTTAIDEVV